VCQSHPTWRIRKYRKQFAKSAVLVGMKCDCPKKNVRCLLALLSEWNGKPLNATAIGKRLDVSRTTAMAWVKGLERQGFARLLPSFDSVRRPLLYLPDSFLGSCVETVMAKVSERVSESRFFWWKTGRVRQIHLLVEIVERRLGFCFCASGFPQNRDWLPLQIAWRRGLIQNGYLLHGGSGAFAVRPAIFCMPLAAFFSEFEDWMLHRTTLREAGAALACINRSAAAALVEKFSNACENPFHGKP
jgi:predicted transcriptional regulator